MSDRPWAAQLAKASWVACLVTLGVGYVGRATGLEAANVNAALGMTIVYALLLIGGFGCGIAALFGVRKFGRRGILLPALIGSTLCLLELVIGTENFVDAFRGSRQRAQQARIEALAAGMQKALPKMSGPDIQFTSVRAARGELVMTYTYVHNKADEIDVSKFGTAVWPATRPMACNRLAPTLGIPVDFRLRYFSADGSPLSELVVKADECAHSPRGAAARAR
jgi:hypothetical protein